MTKFTYLTLTLLLTASVGMAAPRAAKSRTFIGSISDKMCGAKHMMAGKSDKECTLECVKGGSPLVLATAKGKIYDLSDQDKAKELAGQKVKVTGTLKGETIEVSSIAAAQ